MYLTNSPPSRIVQLSDRQSNSWLAIAGNK
jgi:hypothetical protein